MLFNSFTFFLFFICVTGLYFVLPHKFRWALLLGASCYFYMFFIPVYILILFATIIIDYYAGIAIEKAKSENKKMFLVISIIANVGILMFFKYYNFFNDNISYLFGLADQKNPIPYLNILLPIGLSFHTFQAMSYTIEVYRGNQKAEKHFGYYALYVMYYPQLVAGPIERPQNVLHQFHEVHKWNTDRTLHGLQLMLWGLFKKVVVADRLSLVVNTYYEGTDGWNYLIAAIFFSFQIYCDFSGYSDIAIGSSKIMGIDLMQNFNKPYSSKSISEFWSRWHISLSSWFKDYVYIPLGGSREGTFKWIRNIFIIFILSGFWHGANWTFVIWGLLHALFTVFEIAVRKLISNKIILKIIFNKLITFGIVCLAWVFFRINNIEECLLYIKEILYSLKVFVYRSIHNNPLTIINDYFGNTFSEVNMKLCGLAILLLLLGDLLFDLYRKKLNGLSQFAFFLITLLLLLIFGINSNEQFIYFQF